MSNYASFQITDFNTFKNKMLNWANRFNIFCLLDNQRYNFNEPAFECLLAVGCRSRFKSEPGNTFTSLKDFSKANPGWLFGHFSYDLKNETEDLHSNNFDGIGFPDCSFFVPEIVLKLSATELTVFCDDDAVKIFAAIEQTSQVTEFVTNEKRSIKSRFTKDEYIDAVNKIKQHILRGDCYEINFCQEFFSEATAISPLHTYLILTQLSPNPFAALYKLEDKYCICASPERYLKKTGSKLISQPIKGTSKRKINSAEDLQQKEYLLSSAKEKSENVMIVDLVRNDLSRICKEGSVKVEELFGVYSFPQVHQMISTVSGEIKDELNWVDAVKATFPMGSMTGAPKKKVMELIEQYEKTKRGLFSGTIGYVDPDGDLPTGQAGFDFNVVIRSIFYNASSGYLSFQAGGGITFYSDAEKEYEECLMKAEAIMKVLE